MVHILQTLEEWGWEVRITFSPLSHSSCKTLGDSLSFVLSICSIGGMVITCQLSGGGQSAVGIWASWPFLFSSPRVVSFISRSQPGANCSDAFWYSRLSKTPVLKGNSLSWESRRHFWFSELSFLKCLQSHVKSKGFWSWEVGCAPVWGVHVLIKLVFYKIESVEVYLGWEWH